jgi:hypothetical protein
VLQRAEAALGKLQNSAVEQENAADTVHVLRRQTYVPNQASASRSDGKRDHQHLGHAQSISGRLVSGEREVEVDPKLTRLPQIHSFIG